MERAEERYGADLTDEDLATIVSMIQSGQARYGGPDWPTNSFWFVDYKGFTFKVVYNGREKRICIFLPIRRPRSLVDQAPLS